MDSFQIRGFNGSTANATSDGTNRTAAGCYTQTADALTRAGKGFMVYLNTLVAGSITISNVTATWDTRMALGAASGEVVAESGEPAADGG